MENTLGVRISISTETEHLLQTVVQLVHCSVLKKKNKKNFLAVKNKYLKRYNEKAFVQLKFEKEMPRIQNSVRLLHFFFLIYLFFFFNL